MCYGLFIIHKNILYTTNVLWSVETNSKSVYLDFVKYETEGNLNLYIF